MKKAYVFLANGFEEVEAVTPIDFLRRAEIETLTVAVGGSSAAVTGSHGIVINADLLLSDGSDFSDAHMLIFPGGMPGAANLGSDALLRNHIVQADDRGCPIAAICAAPAMVLGKPGADILGERRFTCYPGFEQKAGSGRHEHERVVQDGNLLTSVGAGSAAEFALAIIEKLAGADRAEAIRKGTLQPF